MNNELNRGLLELIERSFLHGYKKSDKVNDLLKRLRSKDVSYEDAQLYAIELGEILSNSLLEIIDPDKLPNKTLFYDIGEDILFPTLNTNYGLISDYSGNVQKYLNEKANIHLKTQRPSLNESRIKGIVSRMSNEPFDDISWMLKDPIINFCQSVVDDSVKANVDFQYKSGLHPTITRKVKGSCCKWCMSLAGTYKYPQDIPKDIFRRHRDCRCTVEYDPKDGRGIQDTHSKNWRYKSEIEKRIQFSKGKQRIGEDVTAEYFGNVSSKKKITYDERFAKNKHKEEVKIANFLLNKFGGDINLLDESLQTGVKMPDYLWNGKYWELKTITTEKAADSALRKALKQIENNPGGIVLDFKKEEKDFNFLLEIIDSRMQRSKVHGDIMIISDNKIKIYRYKKR